MFKSLNHRSCESCILNKQIKEVSFYEAANEPKAKKLELVHTNVWGSIVMLYNEGSKQYMAFIDEVGKKILGLFVEKYI